MKVIIGLVMFLYTVVFIAIGCGLVALSLDLVTQDMVTAGFDYLYSTPNIQIFLGAAGGLLLFISFILVRGTMGRIQRKKTIAFDNPEGQVTISLAAIEDMIKRTAKGIPEIKELKPTVVASKRGVNVATRLTLYSDHNIPSITERIQSSIKNQVQDMLGIEEAITVKVDIVKIVHRGEITKVEKTEESPLEKSPIPFRGIEYGSGE